MRLVPGCSDLDVAPVECDGMAHEPSADLRVWLVNEVPACRVSPAVWLQRQAHRRPEFRHARHGRLDEVGVTDVIIGIDPYKGSHTAVALDRAENKLGQLRVLATAGQVDQLRWWASAPTEYPKAASGAGGGERFGDTAPVGLGVVQNIDRFDAHLARPLGGGDGLQVVGQHHTR